MSVKDQAFAALIVVAAAAVAWGGWQVMDAASESGTDQRRVACAEACSLTNHRAQFSAMPGRDVCMCIDDEGKRYSPFEGSS